MSTLSSANVTDGNLVLKERTHRIKNKYSMHQYSIRLHNLGNWLINTVADMQQCLNTVCDNYLIVSSPWTNIFLDKIWLIGNFGYKLGIFFVMVLCCRIIQSPVSSLYIVVNGWRCIFCWGGSVLVRTICIYIYRCLSVFIYA